MGFSSLSRCSNPGTSSRPLIALLISVALCGTLYALLELPRADARARQAASPGATQAGTPNGGGTGARRKRPDLVLRRLSEPPPTLKAGDTLRVEDVAKNLGARRAKASTNRYYVSADKKKGPEDTLLMGKRSVKRLKPKKTSAGSTTLIVPTEANPGPHHLLACADDLKRVRERNEQNNCRASTRETVIGGPTPAADLRVSAFTAVSGGENEPIELEIKVTNIGKTDVEGATTVDVYPDLPAETPPSGRPGTSAEVLPVKAGASTTVKGTWRDHGLAAGEHRLSAIADGRSVVAESDELNNRSDRAVSIGAPVPEPPWPAPPPPPGPPPQRDPSAGGAVWASGANDYGQLGTGSGSLCHFFVRCSLVPVPVGGIENAVKAVAAGQTSYALRPDRTVSAWGNNWYGNLGNGTADYAIH